MYEVADFGDNRSPELGPEPTIHPTARITDCRLGAWTDVRRRVRLHASEIGDYTYLMDRAEVDYATVGTFVSVAADARLGPTNHPIDRPIAHHLTYRAEMYRVGEDDESVFEWRADQPVTVGHDVWIGHGAVVTPGVTIGNGAVVGAGAVVTRDVDPYTVVAGVPAEPIRRRFPEDVADGLEAIAWWDWSHAELSTRLEDLRGDAESFVETYAPGAEASDD